MPQSPDWNKYLDAGAEFVAMTRAQARARAKELVGQGQLTQQQVQGFVDDLVEESRRRTDAMLDVVRKEIQRQVKTLGIATKDDLAKLETKLNNQAKATRSSSGATKKQATKKASAKKATKKASAKKATTKKATKSSKSTKAPAAKAG
jgi:polyhydroxyalkanoate synthesis regulator phasin